MKIKCPECGTPAPIKSLKDHKTTCPGCGMILVLDKILGPDWADKIRARQQKHSGGDAGPSEPAATKPARRHKAPARRKTASRRRQGHAAPEPDHRHASHRHHHPSQGVSPALLWGSIAGFLVVMTVLVVYMMNRPEPESADKGQVAKKKAGAPTSGLDDITDETAGTEDAVPVPDPSEEKLAAKKEPAKTPEKKKKASSRKAALTPFGLPKGVAQADFDEAKKQLEVLKDLNATRALGIAKDKLTTHPRAAIPVLINGLLELDVSDPDDSKRGFQMVDSLKWITGKDDIWESEAFQIFHSPDSEKDKQGAILTRKQAVKRWWRWWNKVQDTWQPPKEDEEGN
ncbi:MAG TPA: hypothetical protein ENK43_07930 [Planctomycetes bacterium]|nr:hypothetical protein [Planctomycetota bacterium]